MSKNERGIWQRRYWEHLVRDDADFQRRLDYIHYNPSNMAMPRAPRIGRIPAFGIGWSEAPIHWIGRRRLILDPINSSETLG